MKVLFYSLAFVFAVAFASKCSKSDPQLESCLLNKVEALRYDLMKGLSKINLPALDPFTYGNIHTKYEGADFNLYNVKAEGARYFKIKHFSIKKSDDSYELEATVVVPRLTVRANYEIRKKVLWWYTKEKGPFLGLFHGIKVELKVIAKPKNINGKTYLKPEYISAQLKVDDGNISLGGGFVASVAEAKFRKNKRSMFSNLNSKVRPIANRYIKQILEKVPVDEVLSE